MQLNSTLLDDLTYNLEMTKIDKRYIWVEGLYKALQYRTQAEIAFDNLEGPMVDSLLSQAEIKEIDDLTRKGNYTFKQKFQVLDSIFKPKGYKRGDCGTNRVVYIPFWNDKFVVKVALDRAAKANMPDELVNQKYLKPFVCKCFDIDEFGNIGVYERVIPIRNLDQFWSIREDVYNIIQKLIKRFVIDDFGTKVFKNWGVREGFGPVLLDYADMYLIDPETLYCKNIIDFTDKTHVKRCGGRIGYDAGYNTLICLDCGRTAKAAEFKGRPKMAIRAPKRRENIMKFKIYDGDELVFDSENHINKLNQPATNEKTVVDRQLDQVLAETNERVKKINDEHFEEIKEINNRTGLDLKPKRIIEPLDKDQILKSVNTKHLSFLSRNKASLQQYEANRDKIKATKAEETTIVVKSRTKKRRIFLDLSEDEKKQEETSSKVVQSEVKQEEVIVKPKKKRKIIFLDDSETTKPKETKAETTVETSSGETIKVEPVTVEVESNTAKNTDVKEGEIEMIKVSDIESLKEIIKDNTENLIEEQTNGTPFSLEELTKLFSVLKNTPKETDKIIKLTSFIPKMFLYDFAFTGTEFDESKLDKLAITYDQYEAIKPELDELFNTVEGFKIDLEESMYGEEDENTFEVIHKRKFNKREAD